MSSSIKDVDENELPGPFRDGLAELRRTHRDQTIELVVMDGNMVVVGLGSFDVTRPQFEEDLAGRDLKYANDTYDIYARIARSFPEWSGGNAKGFGTSPPLERIDHPVQNNPDWAPEVQEPLQEHLDKPVEMYSWSWDGVPISQAEDMKFAFDLAERMLKHG